MSFNVDLEIKVGETAGFFNGSTEHAGATAECIRLLHSADPVVQATLQGIRYGLQQFSQGFKPEVAVDIGSGPSTILPKELEKGGLRCISIDPEAEYVQAHIDDAHHEARIGNSGATGLLGESASIVTASQVLGWLGPDQRAEMIKEAYRISTTEAAFVFSDRDWSGTVTYSERAHLFIQTMKRGISATWADSEKPDVRFSPDFGKELRICLRSSLHEITGGADILVDEFTTKFDATLGSAYGAFEDHVDSLTKNLRRLGDTSLAGDIVDQWDEFKQYTQENPDEKISLPPLVTVWAFIDKDLVNTVCVKTKDETIQSNRAAMLLSSRRSYPMETAVRQAKGDQPDAAFIRAARQFHANRYRLHLNPSTAIEPESGILVEEIDPQIVVLRSIYYGLLQKEPHAVGAIARSILPSCDMGLLSLPAYQLLTKANIRSASALAAVIDAGGKTLEISGVAANGRVGETGIPSVIVPLVKDAVEAGYKQAIATVVTKAAPLFSSTFGHAIQLHDMELDLGIPPEYVREGRGPIMVTPVTMRLDGFLEKMHLYQQDRNTAIASLAIVGLTTQERGA